MQTAELETLETEGAHYQPASPGLTASVSLVTELALALRASGIRSGEILTGTVIAVAQFAEQFPPDDKAKIITMLRGYAEALEKGAPVTVVAANEKAV